MVLIKSKFNRVNRVKSKPDLFELYIDDNSGNSGWYIVGPDGVTPRIGPFKTKSDALKYGKVVKYFSDSEFRVLVPK